MPRMYDFEFRVQEYPLCIGGSVVLADSGWVSTEREKTSMLLDDYGELMVPIAQGPQAGMMSHDMHSQKRPRYRKPYRLGLFSVHDGISKALLRSFFW